MDKEAYERYMYHVQEVARYENILKAVQCLRECREDKIDQNGRNLYVFSEVIVRQGFSLEQLGTSREEVENFLVQDVKGWIERMKSGTHPIDEDVWDMVDIMVLFLDKDFQPGPHGLFNRLGITIEEFYALEHDIDVRSAREWLTLCRTQGPSNKFHSLNHSLTSGQVTLEEIGATQEEIDAYVAAYGREHYNPNIHTISIT